jgi:hypothetical protein
MTEIRTSRAGFSPFAPSNALTTQLRSAGEPAIDAAGCDYLGAELRTLYADLLAAPVPDRFVALLEQLDASGPEDGR